MRKRLLVVAVWILPMIVCASSQEILDANKDQLVVKQTHDLKSVKIYRAGLALIIKYAKKRNDIFSNKKLKN